MSGVPRTVPNALAIARLVGAPFLVALALHGGEPTFLALFLLLEATDWLDGKLAARLDQRSDVGARLDTVADAAMYLGLLAGLAILRSPVLEQELEWIVPALVGCVLAWGACLARFRVMPSYHAYSAKASWFLALLAVPALLLLDLVWPVRVAAVAVTLANLESVALTVLLDRPRSDVASVFTALTDELPDRGS